MIDYTSDLNAAIEDIAEAGRVVDLVSYVNTGPSYDPVMTPVILPDIMAVEKAFKSFEIDGTLVKTGDKRFLIAGDTEPTVNMELHDGGKKYAIKNIEQVKPGDTLILSKVQARL